MCSDTSNRSRKPLMRLACWVISISRAEKALMSPDDSGEENSPLQDHTLWQDETQEGTETVAK